MSTHQDDLDLLLSLQDRVLETPPASPSTLQSAEPGYLSDDGSPKRVRKADMSVFRDSVGEYLKDEPNIVDKASRLSKPKNSNDVEVDKFSGLRFRMPLVSAAELSNQLSDIRFVQLPAIRNLIVSDNLSGCWATVGVLVEKGDRRVSSTGKNFCIWRIGCLDENTIPVFLFGDAYTKNCNEMLGTVFAFFNAGVRKDTKDPGFSLSLFSANHILKMGTSVDYVVCKGKRKDGMACTVVLNKRNGIYCKYHKSKTYNKYTVVRSELKGGNLRTAFRDPLNAEGIYLVDPLGDKTNVKKSKQPVKLLSVEGLKKALRQNAPKKFK
ncbi:protein MCM10 homolog isoform X2 [Macadamia integrifolia]|uniref:protein MCM10 homolog isoform X2 n=1 Tax=Macadamia integrifolia TaxID=60698 RepID=UPI001C52B27C|nr:protein MCM10 homolog isoform X2 [Macadamia integrifolia]